MGADNTISMLGDEWKWPITVVFGLESTLTLTLYCVSC